MAITDLTNKILNDAQREKDEIIQSAKNKVQSISDATDKKKKELEEEHQSEIGRLLKENERKIQATASLEAKMKIEEKKREIIDSAFSEALSKITGYDEATYNKWIEGIASVLPKDVSGVLIAPSTRLAVTKKALVKAGVSVTGTEEGDIKAGFVIRGKESEYNMNIDELLKKVRDEKEIEIANILFS